MLGLVREAPLGTLLICLKNLKNGPYKVGSVYQVEMYDDRIQVVRLATGEGKQYTGVNAEWGLYNYKEKKMEDFL